MKKYDQENLKFSLVDRLLIFFIKLKRGLTSSAIYVLFCTHRTTNFRVLFTLLKILSSATVSFVNWPDEDVIKKTML